MHTVAPPPSPQKPVASVQASGLPVLACMHHAESVSPNFHRNTRQHHLCGSLSSRCATWPAHRHQLAATAISQLGIPACFHALRAHWEQQCAKVGQSSQASWPPPSDATDHVDPDSLERAQLCGCPMAAATCPSQRRAHTHTHTKTHLHARFTTSLRCSPASATIPRHRYGNPKLPPHPREVGQLHPAKGGTKSPVLHTQPLLPGDRPRMAWDRLGPMAPSEGSWGLLLATDFGPFGTRCRRWGSHPRPCD